MLPRRSHRFFMRVIDLEREREKRQLAWEFISPTWIAYTVKKNKKNKKQKKTLLDSKEPIKGPHCDALNRNFLPLRYPGSVCPTGFVVTCAFPHPPVCLLLTQLKEGGELSFQEGERG